MFISINLEFKHKGSPSFKKLSQKEVNKDTVVDTTKQSKAIGHEFESKYVNPLKTFRN